MTRMSDAGDYIESARTRDEVIDPPGLSEIPGRVPAVDLAADDAPDAPDASGTATTPGLRKIGGYTTGDRYELLLTKLAGVEDELSRADKVGGRTRHLEEASSIIFDLLYSLDFKEGGELVPRLAALYGYIANQLLVIGKSGDKSQLIHIRDMITSLRQSWYESTRVA